MFRWMFRKKYGDTTIVIWGSRGDQVLKKKILVLIDEIKPFKRTFFGIQNHPAAMDFVSDAMEVHGQALDSDIKKKKIFFLVPEFEIEGCCPQDKISLWISDKGYCYKIEKQESSI